MGKIVKIRAYEVLQSTGRSTIAAEMSLDDGKVVKTSSASDQAVASYQSKPVEVSRAVYYINDLIGPKLVGVDTAKQAEVDAWLLAADKTADKSHLGVNTIWTISSLLAKAQAKTAGAPLFRYLNSLYGKRTATNPPKIEKLPSPIVPVLWRKDLFDFKEFCVTPTSSLGFAKSMKMAVSLHESAEKVAAESPPENNFDVFEIVLSAMASQNLKLAIDVFIALNFGASFYYHGGSYNIKDKPQPIKSDAYLEYISTLVKKYFPLFLIDPLANDDLSSWISLNATLSKETYLVGGDLIATSADRLKKFIAEKTCSSILIKPAQAGTITEVFDLINMVRQNNFDFILASSDFETGETIVADLGVATGADFVKFGPPVHEEDICKYNRMLEIERELI